MAQILRRTCRHCEAAVPNGEGCECGFAGAPNPVIKCACGRVLECEAFTEECGCGRLYNWAGQELAPRSQWSG